MQIRKKIEYNFINKFLIIKSNTYKSDQKIYKIKKLNNKL